MGNCVSKNKNSRDASSIENSGKEKKSSSNLDLNLHGYPPINFRKIRKSGFRIGAHVDIGIKDFEAGMTFGRNNTHEIKFSENNNHLKLLKSLENEDRRLTNNSKEKDKIIASFVNELAKKETPQNENETYVKP